MTTLPPRALGALTGVYGVHEVASQGSPLRTAIAARAAFDLTDAVAFGVACPPAVRRKVIATPALFGLVCASSAIRSGRRS